MLATSRWILSMMAAAGPAGGPPAGPRGGLLGTGAGGAPGGGGPTGRGGGGGVRWVAVLGKRAIAAGLDQRQARAGAVEGEIDGSRQNGLTDLGAALERNELNIDAGALGEQQRAQPRRDRARAHVELSRIG